LNRDGNPDLVAAVARHAGTVSVLLNKGEGRFKPRVDYATEAGALTVTIGDLNDDRKPDLAIANHRRDVVSVFLRDGSFLPRRDYRAKGEPLALAIGDLNGDGKPDLASANLESSVSVLVNKGGGSFETPVTFPGGFALGSIAIGDLNGDGKADLVIAGVNEEPAVVYVLLNSTGA
jgi:uncharacterized protein (DUF2141 family)